MKELSIKEKAKAYDYAVNKAKELILNENGVVRVDKPLFDELFPSEMEESEDERIRKELLDHIRHSAHNTPADKFNTWVAWLKKQGESDETKAKVFLINKGYPIDANGVFPTYEEMYNIIREGLENQGEQEHQYKSRQRYVGEEELLGANKQGEQKSAENEELTEFDKAVGVSIGTWNPKSPEQIQSVKAVSKKLLKLAKKQINDEQKPAEWSKDDEQYLLVCKNALSKYQVSDKWDAGIISRWLEERLKSLRPQNRWEPSEEQIGALEHFVRSIAESGFASPYDSNTKLVYSLFNDLKKLK